jgi:hypothetical protein
MPSLLPQIPSWGRVLDHWLAESGRGAHHSRPLPLSFLLGQPTFGETAVGRLLSSSPSSGSPRWNRQPVAGAAGPSGGAGLLILEPRRLLGCQPAYSSAHGMPH